MCEKNITHLRGLYDLDFYERRQYKFSPEQNTDKYLDKVIQKYNNQLKIINKNNRKYYKQNYLDNFQNKRKKSPKRKYKRFQQAQQTPEALLLDDDYSSYQRLMYQFQDNNGSMLHLFPFYSKRIMRKWFKNFYNKFLLKKALQTKNKKNNDMPGKYCQGDIDNIIDQGFGKFEEEEDDNLEMRRNQKFHKIKYTPYSSGIQSVSFEEYYIDSDDN